MAKDQERKERRQAVFIKAYIVAALWSTTNDEGEHLDDTFTPEDFSEEAQADIKVDCEKFIEDAGETFKAIDNDDVERAGHDFWLTRCGHGCGFWDGDWEEPLQSIFHNLSKEAGNLDITIGDDGKLYFC